ncbi:bifunctional diguanylate cyclase/phosphodiesterase [Methylomonas sp. SURF-1]|uniref:Bifunctional diguanylate cyclase/phosphodiesterase n=1 Tax=Methylomonas aurea TaxID=2952224 RepID=A0ABT1UJ45_9GAMM|nr:bifunctional diguanylate cyclase/phosphodiesterase [Methylomonas sp. SURF-1]MCQ8182264.1 bifunctional diguanylate cyclase/phosphodiesterase [Methylomonas sp. SURF-1]
MLRSGQAAGPLAYPTRAGTEQDRFPQDMQQLRKLVIAELTALLESQTRTRIFASSISNQILREHGAMLAEIRASLDLVGDQGAMSRLLQTTLSRCANLDQAFVKLTNERQRQWRKNGAQLQRVIDDFNATTQYLASVLVEKDLFERQSSVLENIILSHEKVSQWKEFVQQILSGFHSIFPFNFFFIAFAEQNELSLYFYYMGDYSDEIRGMVRSKTTKDLLMQLALPDDAPLNIEEFTIPAKNSKLLTIEEVKLISVAVPEHTPGLAGLLGVAFASVVPLSHQEQSIIRSLLSVMVMIVGSSKVLSRTLSELEYYSTHDPLTGIHNRRYFNDMLEYEIPRSERHNHEFSVLLLDLDDFKDINDSYGHPVGDSVLIKIAATISSRLRKGDIPVRMGGDEFAIILPETPLQGAKDVAESIRSGLHGMSFETPDGKTFHVSTSVGVICYPRDAQSVSDLMSGVDIALYRAKQLGKNEVCVFDADANTPQALQDSRSFVEELRQALTEDRFQPYFQPIVDCKTGEIFAYESVARLFRADQTTVAAGTFIETIEKYGLSRELDRIIVRKVIEANKANIILHGAPQRLFINLSAQEIQGRGILGFAEQLCERLGVPPSSIVFEILERDAIGDMSHMGKFLANLRKQGFAFALDDFGSGYNSFHYLRELHFEYVKIDGAFVRNIVDSKIDLALVSNLSRLCRDLGTLTIGEYVESAEILAVLQDIGIDYAQGFYLGIPKSSLP